MNWRTVALAWVLTVGVALQANAAQDAVLTDFDGQAKTIESYTGDGKWLLVMYWANDCGICNQEAASFAQFHRRHADKDARVLGISIDGEDGIDLARGYIKRHDLPFPNLIGEPAPVMLQFMTMTQESFRGTPTFLLYSPNGSLKAVQVGAVSIQAVEAYIARNTAAANGH